jgi:hypothetical protein
VDGAVHARGRAPPPGGAGPRRRRDDVRPVRGRDRRAAPRRRVRGPARGPPPYAG